MECNYCFQAVEKDVPNCTNCGAVVGLMPRTDGGEIEWGQPLFYNGYIVWWFRNIWEDCVSFQFWLGDKVIETLTFSREVYKELAPEGIDRLPMVWDMFKLTQDEDEVLRIIKQNWKGNQPALFDIKYVPSEREEYARSMSPASLRHALRLGQRNFTDG